MVPVIMKTVPIPPRRIMKVNPARGMIGVVAAKLRIPEDIPFPDADLPPVDKRGHLGRTFRLAAAVIKNAAFSPRSPGSRGLAVIRHHTCVTTAEDKQAEKRER